MPEMPQAKPLPVITNESSPFWEGCRQGQLRLQYCEQCQHYQFYPRLYCMQCSAKTVQWRDVSGRGVVYSYTIIHLNKAPAFVNDTPYTVVIVQLEEGPRILSNIVDIALTDVRVDLPVTVVFDTINEQITLPRFRPL